VLADEHGPVPGIAKCEREWETARDMASADACIAIGSEGYCE
jgi:hypothetical protein